MLENDRIHALYINLEIIASFSIVPYVVGLSWYYCKMTLF